MLHCGQWLICLQVVIYDPELGLFVIGITVDDLPERLLLKPDERSEGQTSGAPPALSAHVTGAFKHDGRFWLEFDYRALFDGLAKRVGVRAV